MKGVFCSLVVNVFPYSGCFITCIGAHFPAFESSTLPTMSGFLLHSSEWPCQFGCFLQFMSAIEVLGGSLNINLNYGTAMLHLHPSLNHYIFDCILKDPWPFCAVHYIFDSFFTHLTLRFNTIYVIPFTLILCVFIVFSSNYFGHIQTYFKPI